MRAAERGKMKGLNSALWNLRWASLLQLCVLGLLATFETVAMKDHGLTEGQIGWILGLENGLMVFTALAWGRWADHSLKFRRGVIIGSGGVMVSLWLFSRAETMEDFVLYGIFRGLSTTSLMGLMPAMALANLDQSKPGTGFGGYRRYGSIGFLLAAAGLPLVFDTIPQMALALMGALPLSVWFVLKLSDPVRSSAGVAMTKAGSKAGSFWLFLVAHFFVSLAEPGVYGFFSAYARELGASIEWVGMLSGLTGLIALVSFGFMGRLADRIGAEKILIIGFAVQGVRMGLTSFITDPNWLWVPHLLHSFGWAGREVGTLLFLSAILGKARLGLASSLVMSVRMAGMMVGAMMMGQIAESAGYVMMYRVVSGCVFVGLVVLVWAVRSGKRSAATMRSPK